MNAHQLVNHLLESDEIDPKAMAMRTEEPYWEAATWALKAWLNHMPYAKTETLANYIRNITRETTNRFTLDDDDQAEISRMLMRAWQHERLDMKSSEIEMLKQRALGESDEIDPKGFVQRTNTVDLDKLRSAIYEKSPTLGLIRFHLLRIWNNSGRTRWELNVLLAQEPVSDKGLDPRHDVGMDIQRDTIEAVKEFLAAHSVPIIEVIHRICSASYRGVCPAKRIVFMLEPDDGVDFINHDNEMSG